MSPEQARGAAIDHRTDLWALGVIAFECLCGRLPFTADAPGELVLQICSLALPVPSQVAPVPPAFDDWFVLACNRDPNERFATAKAMAEALRSALLQRPDTESAASVTVPSAPPPPPAFSHAPAAPRSPTMSGGSTVDFLPRPRRSASLGALLSFAALVIAAGLFVRWLVVRGDSGAPGQPVVAASPTGVDRPAAPPPAKDPSSGAASDPSVPSPNDASSGAPSSLPSPGGTPAGTPSGARSTKTLPSSRAGDPPSAPGMTAPSTKSPPALLPTTAPTTTGTDRLGI